MFLMEVSKELICRVFINILEGPSFVLKGGELGEKEKLRRMESVAASTVLQLRLRTNHVDALAVDAWATLACSRK